MDEFIIQGKVEADGTLVLESNKVDLSPGKVEVVVRRKTYGVTLEEAKHWLANPPQLTEEERKRVDELYDSHRKNAEHLNLPSDFIDNLDHYLYGLDENE